eukprot:5005695-Prymnesium_polylepis.1
MADGLTESSRIDPAIGAADGKTGRWALARVNSYTIPIDPGHTGPRGPAWRRRENRICYNSLTDLLCPK